MVVDFSRVLVDLNGEVIKDVKDKPATLKGVSIDALMAVYQDEVNLVGEEKLKRYQLATKISRDEKDFTVEDVGILKKLIGKAYGALIVGQAWDMLEGS